MARTVSIPTELDVLCEGCGYVLNGLPDAGRCPECGKPMDESAAALRHPPAWEASKSFAQLPLQFLRTSVRALVHPRRFFRTLSVRGDPKLSHAFAQLHWLLASILFGTATWVHMDVTDSVFLAEVVPNKWLALPALIVLIYVALVALNRLAARLTTWEAGYRGIRLPLAVVMRGLHYHAVHYLPVALLMLIVTFAYQLYVWHDWNAAMLHGTMYLYVLSGVVIACAGYLFQTYWIAMRNLMYANAGSESADGRGQTPEATPKPADV